MGILLLSFFIIFIISLQVPISFITIHGLLVFSKISVVIQSWFFWKCLTDYTLGPSLCSCSNLSMGISHGWTTSVLLWIKRVMLEETGMKPGSHWHGPPSAQVVTCYDPAAYSCQQPARKQPTPIHFSGGSASAPHIMLEPRRVRMVSYKHQHVRKNKTPLT